MENVDDERKLKEFTEAAAMQRFEAGILFGELTVYLAMFGGLLNAYYRTPPLSRIDQVLLSCVGLGLSLAFTVINSRGAKHLLAVIRRAEELGRELGMPLYDYRPIGKTVFSGLNAVRFIYILGIATWIILILRGMVLV
ncbi:MAG: hypothetical protein U1F76_15695 [Candidatus Competibacteraceae bacterium]